MAKKTPGGANASLRSRRRSAFSSRAVVASVPLVVPAGGEEEGDGLRQVGLDLGAERRAVFTVERAQHHRQQRQLPEAAGGRRPAVRGESGRSAESVGFGKLAKQLGDR